MGTVSELEERVETLENRNEELSRVLREYHHIIAYILWDNDLEYKIRNLTMNEMNPDDYAIKYYNSEKFVGKRVTLNKIM